jgi:hypothetical protein
MLMFLSLCNLKAQSNIRIYSYNPSLKTKVGSFECFSPNGITSKERILYTAFADSSSHILDSVMLSDKLDLWLDSRDIKRVGDTISLDFFTNTLLQLNEEILFISYSGKENIRLTIPDKNYCIKITKISSDSVEITEKKIIIKENVANRISVTFADTCFVKNIRFDNFLIDFENIKIIKQEETITTSHFYLEAHLIDHYVFLENAYNWNDYIDDFKNYCDKILEFRTLE